MKVMAFSITLSLILYLSKAAAEDACGKVGDNCGSTDSPKCCIGLVCALDTKKCTLGVTKNEECLVDSQNCIPGYFCPPSGYCDDCPNVGDPCNVDKDCTQTSNCNQNLLCKSKKCAPYCSNACLYNWDNCDYQNDMCCPSMGCWLVHDKDTMKCASQGVDGWNCGNDRACVDGFKCGGKCHPCTFGAPCTKDSACCGDLQCINSHCFTSNTSEKCGTIDDNCGRAGDYKCCQNLPCIDGKCKSCVYRGRTCNPKEPNCCEGTICNEISKKCVVCMNGAACTDVNDCNGTGCAGHCFNPEGKTGEGTCISCAMCTNNGTCGDHHACCKNHYCDSHSKCQICRVLGESCSQDIKCCDGYVCSDASKNCEQLS